MTEKAKLKELANKLALADPTGLSESDREKLENFEVPWKNQADRPSSQVFEQVE